MRTTLGVMAVLMFSMAMSAQMPMGGTFSNVQAQLVQYGTPITSPPFVSLGNGLTPTVITNRQPYVVGAPQYVPAEVSNVPANGEQNMEPENLQEQPATAAGGARQMRPRRRFDFVVSSDGAQSSETSSDTQSIVEVAAATRKAHVTPVSGKAFTNDDVGRMNQKYGMRPQPSTPANPEQQTTPVQNAPAPPYANPPKR